MSQIDTYRNTLLRKKEELAKLNTVLPKGQAKLSPLQKKIISASNALQRAKSDSTARIKRNEIEHAQKNICDIQKKIGGIQTKIAKKEKEITTADKNLRNEEAKLTKKQTKIKEMLEGFEQPASAASQKRFREAVRQSEELEQRMHRHELIQSQLQMDVEYLKTVPNHITVLFLAANPTNTPQLRLDEEARAIQNKIRLSDYRESVRFESRWATRSSDILQAINETNPTIVHFSGHGTENGELVLLNPEGNEILVKKEAITLTMATASDTIRLVVFNACFSESQAENVVEYIDSAIGMSDSIGDEAACVFAAQLYSSIGFGKSLQNAFNQAITELMLEGIPEETTPKLYSKKNVTPNEIILVQPEL